MKESKSLNNINQFFQDEKNNTMIKIYSKINEKFKNISEQAQEEFNQLVEVLLNNKNKLNNISLLEENKEWFDEENYNWNILIQKRKKLKEYCLLKQQKNHINDNNNENTNNKNDFLIRSYINPKDLEKLIYHKKILFRNNKSQKSTDNMILSESTLLGKNLFSNPSLNNFSKSNSKINLKSPNQKKKKNETKIKDILFKKSYDDNFNKFKHDYKQKKINKNPIIKDLMKKRIESAKLRNNKNKLNENIKLKYSETAKRYKFIDKTNSDTLSELQISTYDLNDKFIGIFEQLQNNKNVSHFNHSNEFKNLIQGNTFSNRIRAYILKQKEKKEKQMLSKTMKIYHKNIELNKSIIPENKCLKTHKLINFKKFFSKKYNIKNNNKLNKSEKNIFELNKKVNENNNENLHHSEMPLRQYFLPEKKKYNKSIKKKRPLSSNNSIKRMIEYENIYSNIIKEEKKRSHFINKYCMNELGEPSKYENFLFSVVDDLN